METDSEESEEAMRQFDAELEAARKQQGEENDVDDLIDLDTFGGLDDGLDWPK
jgi:hypothetical protein